MYYHGSSFQRVVDSAIAVEHAQLPPVGLARAPLLLKLGPHRLELLLGCAELPLLDIVLRLHCLCLALLGLRLDGLGLDVGLWLRRDCG